LMTAVNRLNSASVNSFACFILLTRKYLVLLSKIIMSHISKTDRKRQIFIHLKSLDECGNVIDCVFYNIFELSGF